jgi:hypothetical protein
MTNDVCIMTFVLCFMTWQKAAKGQVSSHAPIMDVGGKSDSETEDNLVSVEILKSMTVLYFS